MSVFDAFQNLFGAKPDAGPTVANYLQKPSGIINATHPIDGNAAEAAVEPPAPPSPGAGNPGVLAQLPSALRAKAAAGQPDSSGSIGGGGLGDVLAAGADAGAGHSKWGAFGAGFAKGMKAAGDYDTKQAESARQGGKDQMEALKALFGIQHQQTADTETGRHNLASETNAATNTTNLGKWYAAQADAKTNPPDKEVSPNLTSVALKQITDNTGYKPGDDGFEALTPAQKNQKRDAFSAQYKKAFKEDPPTGMTGPAYSADSPTSDPKTTGFWNGIGHMFGLGGGPAKPTVPAPPGTTPNPATDPADPTLSTDAPPAPRPPVRNIPIMPPAAAPDPTAAAAPPQPTGGPVQIRNADEYNALPPGVPYIDPNGIPRTKP